VTPRVLLLLMGSGSAQRCSAGMRQDAEGPFCCRGQIRLRARADAVFSASGGRRTPKHGSHERFACRWAATLGLTKVSLRSDLSLELTL